MRMIKFSGGQRLCNETFWKVNRTLSFCWRLLSFPCFLDKYTGDWDKEEDKDEEDKDEEDKEEEDKDEEDKDEEDKDEEDKDDEDKDEEDKEE